MTWQERFKQENMARGKRLAQEEGRKEEGRRSCEKGEKVNKRGLWDKGEGRNEKRQTGQGGRLKP